MKRLLFILLLLPILGMGQTKNVLNVTRVFAKADKVLEFEKALAAHVQKYHKGDWAWRVFDIQTGPDANGYMIAEGPTSWDAFDGRGNLGTEHNNDWNKNVAIYTIDRGGAGYVQFVDSLSTVQLTDYTNKVIINHVSPKPGMIVGVIDLQSKLKKVWQAGNESVAVYQAVTSGAPELLSVTRLKNGLKEMADGYRKPMRERYNMAYGAGAWDTYLADFAKYVDNRWSELLSFRADLSSK
jgi:hypothetical protein